MRLAVLLLLWASAGLAETANTGLDRLTRRDQVLGWEAVGRVEVGGGFCTGTLIATDLVLTAGHCVYDQATGQPVDVASMRFRAGLRDGEAIAEVPVARVVAHPSYDPLAATGAASIRHDAALLQLASPIPAAVAAPFAVQRLGAGREVSVVSYARDREDALSWQKVCGVKGRMDGLLAFDCDVYFGSSGAPVFDTSLGRARIVSIISAGRRDEAGTISFGMDLPDVLADLKAALRAGRGVVQAAVAAPGIRRIGAGSGTRASGAHFLRP
ncbi:trypsin-like serine peptidase [Rhodobacter ferrooxidans]|uniref:Peptidase S1 and S6 chymotrypsin/Hap n=1 Tax=Rhodobacter ferrooxidans TaxID=371731 RepID=C8S1M7_9RHOB|nr:trypsin-like peptidase domain-containing protein [Rhodobacter sp. SW2]EEW25200.1 peptidase S1 and S6 chymotrypsin/Hap [Rhodobacter sp. SW2]